MCVCVGSVGVSDGQTIASPSRAERGGGYVEIEDPLSAADSQTIRPHDPSRMGSSVTTTMVGDASSARKSGAVYVVGVSICGAFGRTLTRD